jgi:hypothetical protein
VGGPAPPTTDALARHFDSLYVVASAQGDQPRAALLTAIETPLAFGIAPGLIPVVVDSLEPDGDYEANPTAWEAVASATDTLVEFAAFSDDDATNALLVRRQASVTSAVLYAGLVSSGGFTTGVHLTSGTAGSACALRTPVTNPAIANLRGATCVTLAVTSSDTLPYALWIPGATVTGVLVTRP